jgi:hypothetical protein
MLWAKRPGESRWIEEQQDEGQLLGVWSEGEHPFRYPDFQFDLAGQVRPEVPWLLGTMAGHLSVCHRVSPDHCACQGLR